MKVTSLQKLNTHNIAAVVPREGGVEVRYADGKDPVAIEGVTSSQVMVRILQQENADSGEQNPPSIGHRG